MNDTTLRVASQALNLASDATRARQNLVTLGITGVALLSLPEAMTGWSLVWLIASAIFAAISLTNIHLAHQIESPAESLPHILIALGSGLTAVIISMTIRPISGMFLLVVLIVLSITSERRPFVTAALSVIGVPWWVWLAANSWYWQLMMLVPLVGLGLLAVSHLLDTHAWPESDERILSARAHRYAAWITIALSGIMLVLVGMFTDVSRPWLALAGIILAASIPLEAGIGTTSEGSAKPGLRIVSGAYLIAVACWLIGIA